jgi:hypothetical protein
LTEKEMQAKKKQCKGKSYPKRSAW